MRDYNAFEPAPLTFIVLPVFLACLLVWGTAAAWRRSGAPIDAVRRAAALSSIAACAWMAITWRVAASGIFREWERTPPPFAFLVIAIITLGFTIAFSRVGTRIATAIPLWVLVVVQGFRLPLELAMHGMYARGIMPLQMTYTGAQLRHRHRRARDPGRNTRGHGRRRPRSHRSVECSGYGAPDQRHDRGHSRHAAFPVISVPTR